LVDSDGEPTDYGRETAQWGAEENNSSENDADFDYEDALAEMCLRDLEDQNSDDLEYSPGQQGGSGSEDEGCCGERGESDNDGNDDVFHSSDGGGYSSGGGMDDLEPSDDDW
jgi:hypothetical protein